MPDPMPETTTGTTLAPAPETADGREPGGAGTTVTPAYDYLLVVGPGRSGSDFLFRNLQEHPALTSPGIKEGYYYRSPAVFQRARRAAGGGGAILVDIANLGYQDPALGAGVWRLREEGVRILMVVLLRHHGARAESMMRFRKSRGEVSALRGRRRLEDAVLRDRLTAERLAELYGLPVDLLVIGFPALVNRTQQVLNLLADRCGVERVEAHRTERVNESMVARAVWFSALGKITAVALRHLGFRKTLQRLKDDARVGTLFFTPSPNDAPGRLSRRRFLLLEETWRDCRALVEQHSVEVADGVFLRLAPRGSIFEAGAGDGGTGGAG